MRFFVAMLSLPDVVVRGTDRKVAPLIFTYYLLYFAGLAGVGLEAQHRKDKGVCKRAKLALQNPFVYNPPGKTKERWNMKVGKMRRRGGKRPGHREKERDGEEKDRKRERKEWKRNEKKEKPQDRTKKGGPKNQNIEKNEGLKHKN